jgi:acetyltransferase-like isoleucine patch superfamily enzyme
MARLLTALLLFVLPTPLVAPLLRLAGYRIGSGARVGFSVLLVERLALGAGVRIGHLNLVRARRLLCAEGATIGRSNIVNGPLSLLLREDAALGNRNRITRSASPGVVDWAAALRLGRGSKVTSDHQIDCTRNVSLGEFSILAGSGSQVWTHGYVHATHGPGRYRIDGAVAISHNVYVGSRCIVNLGVAIAPGCIVGAGTVVSKSIEEEALVVGAAVRRLPRPPDPLTRQDLVVERGAMLCEAVYRKRC